MRRLYSTFAGGWPGIGLILMRFALGFALITTAVPALHRDVAIPTAIVPVLSISAAVLLVIGLCTPIAGTAVALLELGKTIVASGGRLSCILVATLGAALALLGPGLWSADSRLFGWKRIEGPPRHR